MCAEGKIFLKTMESGDSSVSIAVGYKLDGGGFRDCLLGRVGEFSVYCIQTSFGSTIPLDAVDSFPTR
jgi:hypothetical protein